MVPQTIQTEIIKYCQLMDKKGWVANHDGNVSVRLETGFVATPTGRSKRDLTSKDLIELDRKKDQVSGKGRLFSEWAVHERIYQNRKDVGAVVHSHCPHAMAVGCANQEMVTSAIPEAVVSLGPGVPLVGLALPNSEELFSELDALLPHYDAVMVGGNGVFSWGTSLELAFLRMELVEHLASTMLKSLPLGGPKLLSRRDVEVLLRKRHDAGLALPRDPRRPSWFGVE